MDRLTLLLLRVRQRLGQQFARDDRDDRGDVPGWVLVVVMTAGLCAALYGIAKDQLSSMLSTALDQVK
jgi:hypothetical protein